MELNIYEASSTYVMNVFLFIYISFSSFLYLSFTVQFSIISCIVDTGKSDS